MKSRIFRLLALAVVIALIAACDIDGGGDTTEPASDTTEAPDATEAPDTTAATEEPNTSAEGGTGGDLTGNIAISGSSTVEPISARVGEAFDGANPATASPASVPTRSTSPTRHGPSQRRRSPHVKARVSSTSSFTSPRTGSRS